MGTRNSPPPGLDDTKPVTRRYLAAAVYFLKHRNFADCRSYALRAKESDPSHPDPTRILTIAEVLSAANVTATLPDYYTIFNLPRFESDASLIESSFKTLSSILDPNANPYPIASEALEVVLGGWSLLSNPLEKSRFDEELRRNLSGCAPENDGGTFWTVCPYCYYVYHYEKVYKECCLRCSNERCRRGFHAVAVGAPPSEVAEKGCYWCLGFMPLELPKTNGDQSGEIPWLPFCPASGDSGAGHDISGGVAGTANGAKIVEDNEFQHHGQGKKMNFGGDASSNRFTNKDLDAEAENSVKGEGNGHGFSENGLKEGKRMKKSVAWSSKKLMGRGCRIDRNVAHSILGIGQDGHLCVGRDVDLETGFGDVVNKDIGGRVEFYEGDDDLLVDLQCDFDMGM